MRISLRLGELLKINSKPHGYINTIAERTGLERHVVSALIHNKYKYPPLEPLGRLCDYLVTFEGVPRDTLPGALFSKAPENFWEMLAHRQSLELCLGMRSVEKSLWVRDCDSSLQGQLLHGIFSVEQTENADESPSPEKPETNGKPQRRGPQQVDPVLVLAPDDEDSALAVQQGRKHYEEFHRRHGDCALVCLGSMKVNPVVELVFAEAFSCKPFVSGGNVAKSRDRCCPIMFRYRTDDPKPPSCAGGVRLSRKEAPKQPGIYFEKENGEWECCPCVFGKEDAALVFYAWRPNESRLEMVLGGFSGLASQFLANMLNKNPGDFWPPSYKSETLEIGAFIVKFEYEQSDKLSAKNRLAVRELKPKARVIPLHESVIRRRVERKKKARA